MKKIKFGGTCVIVQNMCGYRPVYFKETKTYGIHLDTLASKSYTAIFENEELRNKAINDLEAFLDNDEKVFVLEGTKNN